MGSSVFADVIISLSIEIGGEAGPTDKATREIGAHQGQRRFGPSPTVDQ